MVMEEIMNDMEDDTPNRFRKNEVYQEYMERMVKPDLAKEEKSLTKELKISNIRRSDLLEIVNLSDLAFNIRAIGGKSFPGFLIFIRDTFLSGTSSVDGFERVIQNSDIKRYEISEEKDQSIKDKIFKRGNKSG